MPLYVKIQKNKDKDKNKTQNKTNETKQTPPPKKKKTGQREVERIKKTFLENIVFRISSIWYGDI